MPKPEFATRPFFGVEPVLLDSEVVIFSVLLEVLMFFSQCPPVMVGSEVLLSLAEEHNLHISFQGAELHGNNVSGNLCIRSSVPSMARTVYGDHKRYLETYYTAFQGELLVIQAFLL